MSLSIYCPNDKCCKANIYTLNKPKFCGFCGSSLESLGEVKLVKNKSYASRPAPLEEEEPNDELYTSVDMDFQLDFKVEHVDERRGVKLGDLAKAKKTGFGRDVKKLTKKTQKEFIDNVFNEAKNTGKPIEIEDSSPE